MVFNRCYLVYSCQNLLAFVDKYKLKINAYTEESSNPLAISEVPSPLSKFLPGFAKIGKNIEVMLETEGVRFPLDNFGTGIQQILYIIAKLFESNARIILIEEIELNLSPRYQKALFTVFQEMINDGIVDQVFFTTHSRYFGYRSDINKFEITMDDNGVSNIIKGITGIKKVFDLE